MKILTCAKSLFISAVGVAFLSWEEPPDVFYCHSNVVNLQDVTTSTADKPDPFTKELKVRSSDDINLSRSVYCVHLNSLCLTRYEFVYVCVHTHNVRSSTGLS